MLAFLHYTNFHSHRFDERNEERKKCREKWNFVTHFFRKARDEIQKLLRGGFGKNVTSFC